MITCKLREPPSVEMGELRFLAWEIGRDRPIPIWAARSIHIGPSGEWMSGFSRDIKDGDYLLYSEIDRVVVHVSVDKYEEHFIPCEPQDDVNPEESPTPDST